MLLFQSIQEHTFVSLSDLDKEIMSRAAMIQGNSPQTNLNSVIEQLSGFVTSKISHVLPDSVLVEFGKAGLFSLGFAELYL